MPEAGKAEHPPPNLLSLPDSVLTQILCALTKLSLSPSHLCNAARSCSLLRNLVHGPSSHDPWLALISSWASSHSVSELSHSEDAWACCRALCLDSPAQLACFLTRLGGNLVGWWRAAHAEPRGGLVVVSLNERCGALEGHLVPAEMLPLPNLSPSLCDKVLAIRAARSSNSRKQPSSHSETPLVCELSDRNEEGQYRPLHVAWTSEGPSCRRVHLNGSSVLDTALPLTSERSGLFAPNHGGDSELSLFRNGLVPEWAHWLLLRSPFTAVYGPHGTELVHITLEREESHDPEAQRTGIELPRLVCHKIEGDPNVPSSKLTFVASLNESHAPTDQVSHAVAFNDTGHMIINMVERDITQRLSATGVVNQWPGWWHPDLIRAEMRLYRNENVHLGSQLIDFSLVWQDGHTLEFRSIAKDGLPKTSWCPSK